MMHRKLLAGVVMLAAVAMAGCVSLPPETPQLSAEIGKQIIESRTSHLALLGQYMNEKRDRIDEFIAREWIPEFASQAFTRPAVKEAWDHIVSSNNKTERLEFIVGMGSRLQQRINAKRQELIAPINELEQSLTARLNEHYDQMLAANSTLTAFLDSASAVKEREHRVLSSMKIDGKLTEYMGKADEIVGKIVSGKGAYEANKDKIQGILDQVKKRLGGE